jgi:5-methylcytosine-specific restriction protein A
MPYKPAKPCAHPSCPALTHSRYCDAHARQEARRYEQYQRDPATAKRYGRSWQAVRAAYLSAHPLCEMCLAAGKCVPAVLVHHRVPLAPPHKSCGLRGDPGDGGNNSEGNLQSLCQLCHSAHHARDGSRWG